MSLDIWLTFAADVGGNVPEHITLFDSNYTHNVTPMWRLAGVLDALYNSEGCTAVEVLETLELGVVHMRSNPSLYVPLNPPNGWGSYSGALEFLERFTAACRKYPKAVIGLSK